MKRNQQTPAPDHNVTLMSLREVAAQLGASRGYVYALVKRGELPVIELPSAGDRRAGRLMVDPADLDAAIARWRRVGA